jgi:aminoglycoside phosphotransferase (APT) family kinase protein
MKEFRDPTGPLHQLIHSTFPGAVIGDIHDAGGGRGIFSRVLQVNLADAPVTSVVVKAPALGINGEAGRSSGAYFREALAYRQLLHTLDARTPFCHAVADIDGDPWFVLEDLSGFGTIDQLDGIDCAHALALTSVLASVHSAEVEGSLAAQLRGPGPERFDITTLKVGLDLLESKWQVEPRVVAAFKQLLNERDKLVVDFVEAGQNVLCHGDPRADNVMILPSEIVLLDWQQISMSFGEADLAWMLATSSTVEDRPAIEDVVLAHYARLVDSPLGQVHERYVLGMTRPGLAVLMLCTRDTSDSATATIVRESLIRIGHSLADHHG